MKKLKAALIVGATTVAICLAATGCGKETFDTTSTAKLTFNGYDGYGTYQISNEYEWIEDVIDWYGDSINDLQRLQTEAQLRDVVDYEVIADENLSNGDTVKIVAKISKSAEKLAFNLKAEEIEVVVEGLDEVKEIDPFENVTVLFEGVAPNGRATIKNTSDNYNVYYEFDKNSGLSNGDKIKVTASTNMNEENFVKRYGKKLSVTEKEFTVEGLSSYITSIDQIPEDIQNKMKSQAEDSITAYCSTWDEGNKLKKLEFMGYYFLSGKEGFSVNPNNDIYCIYKVTGSFKGALSTDEQKDRDELGQIDESFYTFYRYQDLMLLPDGTCSLDISRGARCTNRAELKCGYWSWGFSHYRVEGYTDLDTMFNNVVTKNIERYSYENTVK